MSHHREEIDSALQLVEARWSESRATTTRHGLERRRRRRRVTRVVAASLVVLAGVGGLWWARPSRSAEPELAVVPVPVPLAPLAFAVESVGESQAQLTDGSLTRGKVLVRGNGVLRAGEIEVSVRSGRVLVERVGQSAFVHVEEGEAVVRWSGREVTLASGEERAFSFENDPEPAPAEVSETPPPPRRPPAPARWRQLAERGEFNAAYDALRATKAPPRDEPEELLLAADVARLSRHPQEALAPLRRLLERYPRDPRTPLAAFTLGRTLLDELGQPAESARAFARARALAPHGPLVDDALAREVEAQARAGEPEKARQLALEYLKRLPDGPRARLVRHHGGLE